MINYINGYLQQYVAVNKKIEFLNFFVINCYNSYKNG